MFRDLSPHARTVLQALFVTFLWSTSWVFIKIGLQDASLPPLTFAGLRYTLAFVCLLLILSRRPALVADIRNLPRPMWGRLLLLGLLYYTINQGAQFLGLALLPAATVNLILSFAGVLVTLMSIRLLSEQPTPLQWLGLGLYGVGVIAYFFPVDLTAAQLGGIVISVIGLLANSGATLIGRAINRTGNLHPIVVSVVSMGFGSILLLGSGIVTQGLPALNATQWLIIGWLAVVNTAFAFTLWNHVLRSLSAMEASIITNAMLIQIPILAWVFLGEVISPKAVIAFTIAGVGILFVQLRRIRWRRSNLPQFSQSP